MSLFIYAKPEPSEGSNDTRETAGNAGLIGPFLIGTPPEISVYTMESFSGDVDSQALLGAPGSDPADVAIFETSTQALVVGLGVALDFGRPVASLFARTGSAGGHSGSTSCLTAP